MSHNNLRIAKIIQETPDARSFVLEIPADLAEKYRYRAGQFLTFRVPHADGAFNRCYSLSSAPETDVLPKVTVKRVAGGKGSNWFHDALKEGGTLDVLPPAGRFVLGEGAAPLLLFGGGSGITPMISLIKSALKAGKRTIRLFYANRNKPSIIFNAELVALLKTHPGRLEVIHHLDAEHGFATPGQIAAAAKGFENAEAYVCGPGSFMNIVETALLASGLPRERVRLERFDASGNDAVPVEATEESDVTPSEITIHFENTTHKVPYKKGQSILEAARAAGLNPLSSCEEGFCASCAAKRIKGKVVLAKNDIYTPDDLASDWILTCQGHCFGPEVEITYDVM